MRSSATLPWRVHWVVVELDARGEIDAHAARCLRQAIDEARAGSIELVLVDLRDLTGIDSAGLELLTTHSARCLARGMDLGLLIRGGGDHGKVAEAFVLAGLGHALRYAADRRPPATELPVRRRLGAGRGARRGRLGRAARRVSPRRLPGAGAT
jgi:anti-anti-sigma factor